METPPAYAKIPCHECGYVITTRQSGNTTRCPAERGGCGALVYVPVRPVLSRVTLSCHHCPTTWETRARAGNVIRCPGCGRPRRVPAAIRRKPVNYQPSAPTPQPRRQRSPQPPAPRKPVEKPKTPARPSPPPPAFRRANPAAPPRRPAPRPAPAPAPAPAPSPWRPAPAPAAARRPAPASPRRMVPARPQLAAYRACGFCADQNIRTEEGTWAPAVAELELYGENNAYRHYYACEGHFRSAQREGPANGWRVYCQGHRIA